MFLELRHLRSLRAIDRSENLIQAAELLHLTPSALSHQIKAIENYFDVVLFLRNHKPLRLTHAGQQLVTLAEQVLPLVERTETKLRNLSAGDTGRLHITIECHACFEWLLPTLEQYHRHWPDVEVDIRMSMSFEPLPALSHGEVDLVISSDRVDLPDIEYIELFEYESLLALANDHPLLEQDWIEPTHLAQQTLITYPVDRGRLDIFKRFLNPAEVEPERVRRVELTTMILQLVAVKQGVAALPDWILRDPLSENRLLTRQLGQQGMKGMLYAAVRENDAQTSYLRAFIELAREMNQTP
ncbi:MAG: LysR family transcriptional regulator [Pseudomonadales bacterium]|nr:LysR family transcriptional regulator [Pseudomonadales bacterium]